jgi:hypothetical protein
MNWQDLWNSMPMLLRVFITGRLRGMLKGLAGALVTAGALQPDQVQPFTSIGLGIVLYVVGEVWSFAHERELARLKK